jgi:flagellar motor switch protein FliG
LSITITRIPARTDSGLKPLQGPDKVAALLLAMGKPVASQLLKHFDPAELRAITRAASELGPVSTAEMEALVEEFAGQFSVGTDLLGTAREVEKLLTGVLPPEQIAEIMSDLLGKSAEPIWDRLSASSDEALAAFLQPEHPQVVAFAMSRVSSDCAAKVLAHLPDSARNGVMRRLLVMKPAADIGVRTLQDELQTGFLDKAGNSAAQMQTRLAEIINKMDRQYADGILQSLAEVRPDEAKSLKTLLFSFEDLPRLTQKARMVLLDQAPAERVVLALRGTEAEFRNVILASLGARARRIVESELNGDAESSARDIADARRSIADIALAMASRGEIELAPKDDSSTAGPA